MKNGWIISGIKIELLKEQTFLRGNKVLFIIKASCSIINGFIIFYLILPLFLPEKGEGALRGGKRFIINKKKGANHKPSLLLRR
jgi:hypothetical protein